MKISVVVPAFNEEKVIDESLRKIRAASVAFTELCWAVEWIVCDNNSTDRTAELARAAGAAVVFEQINQIARARNSGARAATGDWLVFVDADSHPSRELLADVAATIRDDRTLAGGATVRLDRAPRVARMICAGWNLLSRWNRYAAGSFIFCEAAAFRELGGFSTDLFVGEEIEFSKRLKRHARRRGQRVDILHRHPLVTSARKLKLYTPREHLGFIFKTICGFGRTLRSREACPIWYDGRR